MAQHRAAAAMLCSSTSYYYSTAKNAASGKVLVGLLHCNNGALQKFHLGSQNTLTFWSTKLIIIITIKFLKNKDKNISSFSQTSNWEIMDLRSLIA